jgi:hypothetical protein
LVWVGWVHKATIALQPFSDLLFILIWFLIIPNSSSRAVWQSLPTEMLSSEAGETLWEMDTQFCLRSILHTHSVLWYAVVILGGVMVIMLVIRSKVCGFKPGWGIGFLRAIKIPSTTFLEGKWSYWPHVIRFYGVKNPSCKIQQQFLSQFLPTSPLGVAAATRAENSGGWIEND